MAHVEEGRKTFTGSEYVQRLEALSQNWPDGPIRAEEWLTAPLPEPAEPKSAPEPSDDTTDPDDDASTPPSAAPSAPQ